MGGKGSDSMGQTWETQLKVAKGVLILNSAIALFGILIFDPWTYFLRGLIFGTLIALLNFRLLALTVEKSVLLPPNRAQIYAGTRYIIRYIINGIVLVVSLKAENINVLGTIIGIVSIKPVVLKIGLFNDITFFKKIFIKNKIIRKEEK